MKISPTNWQFVMKISEKSDARHEISDYLCRGIEARRRWSSLLCPWINPIVMTFMKFHGLNYFSLLEPSIEWSFNLKLSSTSFLFSIIIVPATPFPLAAFPHSLNPPKAAILSPNVLNSSFEHVQALRELTCCQIQTWPTSSYHLHPKRISDFYEFKELIPGRVSPFQNTVLIF